MTEGRGLPIVESCFTGVPLICKRFAPHQVFDELIGISLPVEDRIKYIDIDLSEKKGYRDVMDVLFNNSIREKYVKHNINLANRRFTMLKLEERLTEVLGAAEVL